MFLLALVSAIASHQNDMCSHDIHQSKIRIQNTPSSRKALEKVDPRPLNVYFQYEYLNVSKNDPLLCRDDPNVSIPWALGNISCYNGFSTLSGFQANQNMSDVEELFSKLSDYLGKFLQVEFPQTKITLKDVPNYTIPVGGSKFLEGQEIDADIVITILLRPFSTYDNFVPYSTIPLIVQKDEATSRPTQGLIIISDINIVNNNATFTKYLHETLHILGISHDLFDKYHPYGDNNPYKDPICTIEKYNRNFTFLTTPKAHIIAKNHFSLDEFKGDNGTCTSGIELQQFNNLKDSHPAARVYWSELMSWYVNIEGIEDFFRITDVTIALLADTGNYIVNYTMGRYLLWLNKKALNIRTEIAAQFPLGPPEKVFPFDYLMNPKLQSFVGFDYQHLGNSPQIPVNCSKKFECQDGDQDCYGKANLTNTVCASKEFYNPENYSSVGSYEFDFQQIKRPNKVCPTGLALIPFISETNNPNPDNKICRPYHCVGYSNFTMTLKDADIYTGEKEINVTCNSTEYKIGYITYKKNGRDENFTYMCPPVEQFCRSLELHNQYFVLDPLLPESSQITEGDISAVKKRNIIIGAVFGILLTVAIVVFVFFSFRYMKKKQAEEDKRRLRAVIARVKAKKRSQTVAAKPEPLIPQNNPNKTGKERTNRSVSAIVRSDLDVPDPNQSNDRNGKGDKLSQILFLQQLSSSRENKKTDDKPQDVESAPQDPENKPNDMQFRDNFSDEHSEGNEGASV